jgi:hypothetical protein
MGYSVQTKTQGSGRGPKSEPEAEVRGGERGIRDPRDHKWTRFGTRKKVSSRWATNAELNYTVTLLLFRPSTPPGFRCCRLFRCSTCLLRSFGLASLNQFVTGELVHSVVLVLKLGCAFMMIDPPTHIMGLLEIRGRFCSKLLRELAQILRFVERHRVLPGVIPRKDEYPSEHPHPCGHQRRAQPGYPTRPSTGSTRPWSRLLHQRRSEWGDFVSPCLAAVDDVYLPCRHLLAVERYVGTEQGHSVA